MKSTLFRLKERLGDFWWYTLMIFCAQRAADGLNAFVGLYLVPKYVGHSELGAVMPLAQFAAVLATPVAVFATTFRQELSNLALKGEFGKLKTLLRSGFIAALAFFVLALALSRFMLPRFLGHIRIAEGSLGFVILVAAFITAIMPIYSNALQSLKKFNAISLISVFTAPLRLVTMLVLMPFRAITGYFCGQSAPPIFTIAGAAFALRQELKVKAEPYWTKLIVKRFARLFAIFGVNTLIVNATVLVETTIIRNRLSEIDSAAYYLVSRFSEFSTILSATLMLTIFPFAAEVSAKGKDHRPLILKCMLAATLFGAATALFTAIAARPILSILPNAADYSHFARAIPALIMIATINQCANFFTTAEFAANRFSFLKWMLPLHLIYTAWVAFGANIRTLYAVIGWMAAFQALRLIGSLVAMKRGKTA